MATEKGGPLSEEQRQQRWRARKRKMLIYGGSGGGLAVVMAIVYFFFFAVVVYETVDEALAEISERYPSARVSRDPTSGFVSALSNLEQSTQSDEPGAWLKMAADFIARPEIAAALGVTREVTLQESDPRPDPQAANYELVRIEQFVEGVRLFGADIAVIQRRSEASAAISEVAISPGPPPAVDLTPAIEESAARATARAEYETLAKESASRLPAAPAIAEIASPERVVFDPSRFGLVGGPALAWRYQIASVQVFISARDGRVIVAYDDRPSARTLSIHDCGLTIFPPCPLVLNEKGALQPKPPVGNDAQRARDALLAAHTYFSDRFNRNGFDDASGTGGTRAISTSVQVPELKNAQWMPQTETFEFGPGWTTLDITAHEYTHAVTHFGPKINYLGQPGAVSEFFSDFFGVMIDRSITKVLDWRIGENLPGRSAASPLRNMATPHNAGFKRDSEYNAKTNSGQPEDFEELVTPSHEICSGLRGNPPDKGCVHFNSGILNKALHLALTGGTFKGTAVTPVELPKVEQIMFRTLLIGGVTSTPTILDAANGAVRSCRFMAERKLQNVTAQDCTALRTAFVAVKIPVSP